MVLARMLSGLSRRLFSLPTSTHWNELRPGSIDRSVWVLAVSVSRLKCVLTRSLSRSFLSSPGCSCPGSSQLWCTMRCVEDVSFGKTLTYPSTEHVNIITWKFNGYLKSFLLLWINWMHLLTIRCHATDISSVCGITQHEGKPWSTGVDFGKSLNI